MKLPIPLIGLLIFVFSLSSRADGKLDDIYVVSVKRNFNSMSSDQEICKDFSMTREDVKIYLSTASEVDEYDFNEKALIFPCKYEGIAEIHGDTLQWEISAGGAGYLYSGNEVNKRLLCQQDCCDALPDLCL